MRVRMIRPAYWTDVELHTHLTADVREFYIGLWMLADDAGYVAWDVDRVGAELYPFRPLAWRRKHLAEWLALLGDHARLLSCGRHVVIPNLSRFQSPPRPSYTVQRAHDTCMRQVVAPASTSTHVQADGSSTGKEGKGKGFSRGSPDGDTSEFQRKMAAAEAALAGKPS